MSRLFRYLSVQFQRFKSAITRIRDTPHAIAGGVAIGIFFGFTPLLGFKTVLAVLVAWLFRCSKLSAALAVTFHDILLPLWPVILRWQFQVGFWIIKRPHHLPPKIPLKHLNYENLLTWKTLNIFWPVFVGSIVIAIPVSVIAYFLVLEMVKHSRLAKGPQGTRGQG